MKAVISSKKRNLVKAAASANALARDLKSGDLAKQCAAEKNVLFCERYGTVNGGAKR